MYEVRIISQNVNFPDDRNTNGSRHLSSAEQVLSKSSADAEEEESSEVINAFISAI